MDHTLFMRSILVHSPDLHKLFRAFQVYWLDCTTLPPTAHPADQVLHIPQPFVQDLCYVNPAQMDGISEEDASGSAEEDPEAAESEGRGAAAASKRTRRGGGPLMISALGYRGMVAYR